MRLFIICGIVGGSKLPWRHPTEGTTFVTQSFPSPFLVYNLRPHHTNPST